MIPLSVPNIFDNEKKYVNDCLDSGWISSAGGFVNKFEHEIKNYVGSNHAVACMNGTVGLQISLILSGVSPNDFVIVPNLTFVATLNSISYTNAEPLLFDVDLSTWQIDLNLVENWLIENTFIKINGNKKNCYERKTGRKISAIMPVHVLGNVCDLDKLLKISSRFGLTIIEDSTEALGSFYNNKHLGTFGKFGVFSFNGNKIISTGGGGMIVTNDKKLAEKAKHITTTAKRDSLYYFHDEIGYNYRLVNILAAIGLGQMENFEKILKRKKEITILYKDELKNIGDIIFQEKNVKSNPNDWLFTFRTKKMKKLLSFLNKNDVQSRPFWTPMNRLPMYDKLKYINRNDNSNLIFNDSISVPSSSNLSIENQTKVINLIKKFFNK